MVERNADVPEERAEKHATARDFELGALAGLAGTARYG
jgi:hypothetical protein